MVQKCVYRDLMRILWKYQEIVHLLVNQNLFYKLKFKYFTEFNDKIRN